MDYHLTWVRVESSLLARRATPIADIIAHIPCRIGSFGKMSPFHFSNHSILIVII